MTKLATALAVGALVERGRIHFDDRVDRYLPWFQPSRPVTIAEVLSHTAGLADPLPIGWVHPPGARRRTPFELTRATFDRHRKLGTPRYTNLGYLVLGELVREIAGAPYADFVRDTILGPANVRARFSPSGAVGHEPLRSWRAAGMALVFFPRTRGLVRYVERGWVGLTPFELEGEAYGGLVGSLDDLVALGRVFLREGAPVIDRELFRAMIAPRGGFGLGCEIYGRGWIGHGGEAGGFRAELRVHPERGIGVAVLASSGTANVREVAQRLSEL